MIAGFTSRLAGAITGLRFEHIPDAALDVARRGIADCVGVMIAGSGEPVVARTLAALGALGPAEARLIPGGESCAARVAALVNGIAAHVLDYDDVAMDGHPSAVLVPALLAECEFLGASGVDFLRGYVAGYEAWGALWAACAHPLHSLGRHPSSSFGPLAAAAAGAALHRLSAAETANALGLAAAQAGGLIANFGSMAKSFQLGRAAEAGLLAARLAKAGIDAAPHALEHEAGFLNVLGGGARPGALGFGQPNWWLLDEGLDIKIYPVCYATHRLVDAALQLAPDTAPAEIATIELRLGRLQSKILHSQSPRSVLEAKFSAEFAVAAVLVAGRLGLPQLQPDFFARDDVQRLIGCCERQLDDALGAPPFAPFDQVVLRLRDGREMASGPVSAATGSRFNPPDQEAAWGKFHEATTGFLTGHAARTLFESLWHLRPDANVAALLADAGIGGMG